MKSEHQQTNDVLQDRLRTGQSSFSAPVGFTERVMERLSAVEQQRPVRRAASVGWLRFGIAFGAAACAAFLVSHRFSTPNPGAHTVTVTSNAAIPASPPMPLTVPTLSVEQVEAWTAKLDQPLEKELKNVISDTRQAIQFVASNFLPEN